MKVRVAGHGKIDPDQSWAPLATGEFLLGGYWPLNTGSPKPDRKSVV